MTKIAVFGSAFNPPSLGHKSVIESLGHFDRVLLEPSFAHAWGKTMLDYALRCDLLDAFIDDLHLSNVERSQLEPELMDASGSVTTYVLLQRVQALYPQAEITFVIGPDNLFNFAKFYKAEEILARWNVMTCPERVAIRSTDIRYAIEHDQSVEKLTTGSVAKLLIDRKLYKKICAPE